MGFVKSTIQPGATTDQLTAREAGFSLMEAVVAMTLLAVVMLGAATIFVFAARTNSGATDRLQETTIAQKKMEQLRSLRFSPALTDELLRGGTRAPETVIAPDGRQFRVEISVDDDPRVAGQQINAASALKEITVLVRKANLNDAENAYTSTPVRLVCLRARTK